MGADHQITESEIGMNWAPSNLPQEKYEIQDFLEDLKALVGNSRVLTEVADTTGYEQDWRGRYKGRSLAVVLPGSTEEVSDVVRLCQKRRIAIVPQGGNTGLTGGAVVMPGQMAVLLNLSRLNRIREVDVRNNAMTVDAGCILANVRSHAEEHRRLFPMLLGSVGSCEVGGLVSTNAGGTGVLRYGNMRELVMGLEVVLPDGEIWNGLRALRKDNTGYDLKQLFIGAEGTLGIITAAVLKLFPLPSASATAMVALESVEKAVDLLRFLQEQVGQRIDAFEILSKSQIEIVLQHGHGLNAPMALDHPWYVLIEIADSATDWNPVSQMEKALEAAMEAELVLDAVVASSDAQAQRIWELRHTISESNKRAGFTVSNDTSVPISRLPQFIDKVNARITKEINDAALCHVGHIGDGNIHVIAVLPRDKYLNTQACEVAAANINFIVHEESVALDGSISAEHGIGRMHVERLQHFKPALDIQMMRHIKQTFDPHNLMNPGKIFKA
jgi:FAD/FMN-containing dehydrogenase